MPVNNIGVVVFELFSLFVDRHPRFFEKRSYMVLFRHHGVVSVTAGDVRITAQAVIPVTLGAPTSLSR